MKDTKSLLLVMLSVGLTGTWVYHLYDKTIYSKLRKEVYIKDSVAVAQGVQDSLHKIYSKTIDDLDARLDSTSNTAGYLKEELTVKLSEINRLRNEIAGILKKNDTKKEDLALARRKTAELQLLVQELESKNTTVEEEKMQIAATLNQVNDQVKKLEGNVETLAKENRTLTEKMNLAAAFVVTELNLVPVTWKKDKETETNLSAKTNKLIVSFGVRNNIKDYSNAELYVVVTQPDGNVMIIDAWESASTLPTVNEGQIKYTRKIIFEYQHGETKKLSFSLSPDEYQKGNYKVALYHNGYQIGQTSKTLL
ncbi:MAG TPA: hypothetical protein VFV31_07835 [Chitinophagaceae bacterium]|nr:hypothetical protein [Chitinophagaceae bacterium]